LLRHDADVTVAAPVRAASGRSAHARSARRLCHRADRIADAEEAMFVPLAFGRPTCPGRQEFGKTSSSFHDLIVEGA
jgi:hypothetical protein